MTSSTPPVAPQIKGNYDKDKDKPVEDVQEQGFPTQSRSRSDYSPAQPFNELLAGALVEEDQALISKIYSKLEQLLETDRMKSQLIILYSGMSNIQFCLNHVRLIS